MNARQSHPAIVGIRRWMWLGYWLGMFVLTHIPVPLPPVPVPAGSDKVVHFGMFAVLVWLGTRYQLAVTPIPKLRRWVAWGLIYATYAGADEWLQRYANRTPSLFDWLADVAGIATATVLLVFVHRRRFRAPVPGSDAV